MAKALWKIRLETDIPDMFDKNFQIERYVSWMPYLSKRRTNR